ncbi:MAG TPA: autotransporter-associated beta strand repeat-containing protein [Verrucomicrobiae bacterium]|nr:autotransporter-associated beta strand repeat-containing protein [Verrucomicrobiae bacterium]
MTTNKFGQAYWMSMGISRGGGILAAAVLLAASNPARAQTFWSWTNTVDGVWSDSSTWSNNLATVAAPAAGGSIDYTISFDGVGTYNSTNDLGAGANGDFSLNQLAFAAGSVGVTLSGSNLTLRTSSGGALPVVTKVSSATATLTMGTTLTTNTTFTGGGLNILVMGGLVSGSGGITMNGTYTLGLAFPTNTYAGDTIVNSGLFQARAENAFPFGPGTGNITVNSGGTLSINNVNVTINGLSGSGNVDKLGTNTKTLNVGANDVSSTFSGNFLVNGGAGTFLNINKIGAGVFTMAGTNQSSGQVSINGGQLVVAYSGALTNNRVSPVGTASVAFSNSTVFYFGALGPPGNSGSATGGIGLTNTAGQAITLYVGNNSGGTFSTFSGQVSGSGTLATVGAFWQRVQGTNATYSGDTLVNEGTLDINFAGHSAGGTLLDAGGWIPWGTGKGNVYVGPTAQIWLRGPGSGSGTSIVHNVNGLSGQGIIEAAGTGGTRNLIVGNNNASSTFAGDIRNSDPTTNYGPIAVTKVGTGTLTLTGTNEYTGGTTINGGVLAVAGDGIISNTASVTLGTGTMLDISGHTGGGLNLASNETLRGFGSIKGNLAVDNGAALAPGTNSALATLTFSNNLALSANSILTYRLGTSSDGIAVGGNLVLGGILNFSDSGGFTNNTYTLFTYGGTLTTNGSPTILTFGDLANSNFTYAINIATPGQVKLVVTCSGCSVADSYTTWQNQYFGCTGCGQAQGTADPDGDGMNNTNEFLAGFVPTNSAAYLHILSIVRTNTDVRVTYLGANGNSTTTPPIGSRTNVLEYTTGTANGSYSNNFVSANVTNILSGGTGVGVVTNMVDPGGATGATRYYRVRVLVP